MQRSDISIHAPRTGSDVEVLCHSRRFQHFNPRSPHGERLRGQLRRGCADADFNPRSPHGERQKRRTAQSGDAGNFNPRSPHGERQMTTGLRASTFEFQSTLPARGATCLQAAGGDGKEFQSTLPARGATQRRRHPSRRTEGISIHAPRTGSDGHGLHGNAHAGNFNPRSPHGERPSRAASGQQSQQFQSTLPARGATRHERRPRPTRTLFQSTLPARGATICARRRARKSSNFNPRSPHGERRLSLETDCLGFDAFQSTLPARGATRISPSMLNCT